MDIQNYNNSKVRAFRKTVSLASQASGSVIDLFTLPKGCVPILGVINASVSLATATIKIGNASDDDKYRAAAVHTVTASTVFGEGMGNALSADEKVILTTGTAALPASGTLEINILCSTI